MNKEKLHKLLQSSTWEDNLLAFHMMKDTKYSELEELLEIRQDYSTGYFIYIRDSKYSGRLWDTRISDTIIVCTGIGAILFIPNKWFEERKRTIEGDFRYE